MQRGAARCSGSLLKAPQLGLEVYDQKRKTKKIISEKEIEANKV